jgi:hypothetical protein
MLATVVKLGELIQFFDGAEKLKPATDNGCYLAFLVDGCKSIADPLESCGGCFWA